jgi:transposase InsO family protein
MKIRVPKLLGIPDISEQSNPSMHTSKGHAKLTPLDIPRLREQWFEKHADILGPIPLELPPLREVNHHIPLINEDMRYNYHLPRCPEALESELREKTNRYLSAGWWEMKAVYQAAPLLCVPKKSGKLRTVVDARKRNENTFKDVTPFPDQDQIRMDVARAKYRTKIDMSDAYEQIRIDPADVWKTAFASPLGTYVSRVMQQGDCNAPATFQRLMTWIFREYLGLFVRVYLDDIFVFSDTIEEHENHLEITFEVIRSHKMFLSRSKLDLYSEDMDCLGHRIDDRGLHADSDKMGRIIEWRTPRSQHEVQRFVGLVQYIAHFMPDVSAYTSPLEAICRNGQPFYWRPLHQTCLDRIKDLARKTPILKPIDIRLDATIWVICDASAFGIGALYGQGPEWQTCRPAGFMSKKFTSAQRSYKTFEHEALAVIEALMKWEDKLVGRQFCIVTDHEALETIKTSNRDGKSGRLIRWDEYLSRFQFTVMHVPGELNKVADCLSRYYENDRSDELHASHHYVSADVRLDPNHEDLTELRLKELSSNQEHILARRLRDRNEDRVDEANRMEHAAVIDAEVPEVPRPADEDDVTVGDALQDGPPLHEIVLGDTDFLQAVKEGYRDDTMFNKIIEKPHHFSMFRIEDGLIHTKNRLGVDCICIPRSRFKGKRSLPEIVIDHAHNTLGHLGPQRTAEYARRWFWWPRMGREIEKFCHSCGTCQMMKTSNQAKPGLLHNLPVPSRPWQSIAMDFVGPFPQSTGLDYLWVVICRLTTLVHLVPITVRTTTTELAWYYTRDIVRLHGMPESIVSDRDSKFTSRFWRELHRSVGTKLLMSTSFHPQTDGHSERVIRSIGQMLRSMVSPDQKDWVSKIPMIEFALNSSVNSSTGFAPFELTYGYMPRITPFPTEDIKYPGVKAFAQRARANLEMAHDSIIEARVSATYHANRHRSEEVPYEIDDLVYLSTVNLNLPKRRARKLAPKYIGPFRVVDAFPETSNYVLELSSELVARKIHPKFHASLLRPYESNDDLTFPSRESKHFYDFGMPDDDEWLVDEIIGHQFTDGAIEFNVRWTAGDHTWEPYSAVKRLEALDHYFALMGVTRWQSLQRRVPDPSEATPRVTKRVPDRPDRQGTRRSSRNRN